jgi:CBS domain-containing protein
MLRTVCEAMHRGVVTASVGATAAEIAQIMLENDVSAVVVADEQLNACGVVTKTDLIACYGKDLAAITAEDMMSSGLITVSPDTLVHEAVQQMLASKVHQLVIVSGAGVHRRPVGILTIGDVVAMMAGRPGPQSAAQVRCSQCIRRLLGMPVKAERAAERDKDEEVANGP